MPPLRDLTLVTFGAARTPRTMPAGTVLLGATTDAFAKDPEPDGTRWVELAYAVSMTESDVTLSKEDFEQCVKNHQRYPCVPVVIEHADTEWFSSGPKEWAEPHGYVEELRVGEREVTEMDGTQRTAATLEGRVSFDEKTAPLVGPTKKWRFGSITLLKGATDEATSAGLGCLLWSWSLTAHPRLTGLLPIAASFDPSKLSADEAARLRAVLDALSSRGTTAKPPTPTAQEPFMLKFLELAARYGLAATSEEDAREKVLAFLALGADALKTLGLAPTTTPQELGQKLSALTVAAAKVPALEKELTELRADKATRDKATREQHFEELFAVQPELKAAESALRYQAEHDWTGFQKAHPRPSPQELLQAAQHPERLTPLVPPNTPSAPQPFAQGAEAGEGASRAVVSLVHTHLAMARAQGREISFTDALGELGFQG